MKAEEVVVDMLAEEPALDILVLELVQDSLELLRNCRVPGRGRFVRSKRVYSNN